MKLTKREAFLLKLMGVVAVLALSYYFIIAPEITKLTSVGEELLAKSLEVETVKAEINSISQLEEEITSLQNTIQASSEEFYPDILQKKLIVILDKVFQDTGVAADSLGFSQVTLKTADSGEQAASAESQPAQENDTGEGEAKAVTASAPQIETMSVTIPLFGTYEQIVDLIQQLEAMNRVIIINSLQMAQGEDGKVSGGMNLDFYALSKLALSSSDPDYLDWPYNSPHGAASPFKFIPSETEETETQQPVTEETPTEPIQP
jgi:Tfp pilus assembly protein PilO